MPRSAIAAGCIDFVLSPEAIAAELVRIARHPYVTMSPMPNRIDPHGCNPNAYVRDGVENAHDCEWNEQPQLRPIGDSSAYRRQERDCQKRQDGLEGIAMIFFQGAVSLPSADRITRPTRSKT
jgi:hypothetical protein